MEAQNKGHFQDHGHAQFWEGAVFPEATGLRGRWVFLNPLTVDSHTQCLGLQIAGNMWYLYTLGPKVGVLYILGLGAIRTGEVERCQDPKNQAPLCEVPQTSPNNLQRPQFRVHSRGLQQRGHPQTRLNED